MGSKLGHFDSLPMLWSRTLRETHDANKVKKVTKEKDTTTRRDYRRTRKNQGLFLREPQKLDQYSTAEKNQVHMSLQSADPQIRPASNQSSQLETPTSWARPRRPQSRRKISASEVSVEGAANRLLRMLHLDHILSDQFSESEDGCALRQLSRKDKLLKGSSIGKSMQRTMSPSENNREPCPDVIQRSVSPLTSWRMVDSENASLSGDLDTPPHVTQWRYKPLPGEDDQGKDTTRKINAKPEIQCDRNSSSGERTTRCFDLEDLRLVVVAMQKEHKQCIRSVTESLEHHTRQVVLLTKANSSLADHVKNMEKEMKVLRNMQLVCTAVSP